MLSKVRRSYGHFQSNVSQALDIDVIAIKRQELKHFSTVVSNQPRFWQ